MKTVLKAYESNLPVRFLFEFPEDLGKAAKGVPASLFQLPEVQEVCSHPSVATGALRQCALTGPG
eukprot:4632453-Lingulodinium_polyedra.AAC.1